MTGAGRAVKVGLLCGNVTTTVPIGHDWATFRKRHGTSRACGAGNHDAGRTNQHVSIQSQCT